MKRLITATPVWVRLAAAAALTVTLTSGCSLKSGHSAIDPPPQDLSGSVLPTLSTATAPQAVTDTQGHAQACVYLQDASGYLVPVTMPIGNPEKIAVQALEYLVEGGAYEAQLPPGFSPVLPKGTQIKSINIKPDQKLAVVDFSKEFGKYDEKEERKIMEAVTWTLTNFSTVDMVSLRINGYQLNEMPVGKTPIDGTLSRAMGINLESSDVASLGQTVPVTLYFLGAGAGQAEPYYIPVTRMIKRTDNIGMASMQQLIAGPKQSSSKALLSTMAGSEQVLDVKLSGDKQTVTVNFGENVLGTDSKVSDEAMQAVILSLTENTGASKVQIMVDGSSKFTGTKGQIYSKPVTRPVHVNMTKM
ncbi:GerMN domain-containing protein [Paenibacillus sp. y28]|uniref:GerMN domain-containing protein n=1 Tax=Paenibacillus sp. y28 TaxID=3129110 RepID=UPI0030197A4C